MNIHTKKKKNTKKLFNTPILFLTYKRINTAKKVFDEIKKIKPKKLYFASNAPILNNLSEIKKINSVRNLLNEVDWKCKIVKIFHKKHLPVSKSIPTSINTFFKYEKKGIILEDDCLPSNEFFYYCEKMLNIYEKKNINVICGSRFSNPKIGKYYFSKYNHAWGWATWRSSWKKFDPDIKFWPKWKNTDSWKGINLDINEYNYWTKIFNSTYKKKINTWDYAWTACAWYHNQLSIIPGNNLINNIGFGPDATWTVQSKQNKIKKFHKINEKIKLKKIFQDKMKDKYVFYNHFGGGNDININKIIKLTKLLVRDPSTILLKIKRNLKNVKKNI